MDILQAARQLRPGTAWVYSLGILTQADDGTPRVSVPTSDELKAVMASVQPIVYPSVPDQLAALWKVVQTLSATQPLPVEVTTMLSNVQAVSSAAAPSPVSSAVITE